VLFSLEKNFTTFNAMGPPAFGGRYVSGLAARSALRGLRPLGLAFGHPCTSLGRLAFGHGGFAACCSSPRDKPLG